MSNPKYRTPIPEPKEDRPIDGVVDEAVDLGQEIEKHKSEKPQDLSDRELFIPKIESEKPTNKSWWKFWGKKQ